MAPAAVTPKRQPTTTRDWPAVNPAAPGAALLVLARSAEVYAGCGSYRDTGVVQTFTEAGGATWQESRPFATAFARPDRLRLDFRDRSPAPAAAFARRIVWSNGQRVRSWDTSQGQIRDHPTLDAALRDAAHASADVAHLIPRLLSPERVSGPSLAHLVDARVAGVEPVDGADCLVIEGRRDGRAVAAWVDRNTYLVRRVSVFNDAVPGASSQTVITYRPKLDPEIDPRAFEFRGE